MLFYSTAFITLLSAVLGLLFSIQAIIKGKGTERENTLYIFARSIAVLCASTITLIIKSNNLLLVITGTMMIVQIVSLDYILKIE
ncbi:hypothetical protein NDGK_00056 [Clostridiales bacterium CHKCI001]|nr:hypothetical protein NDGK_00056 [Clostridiales bacterium CHKCI001]